MTIDEVIHQIEETERLIAVYRNVGEVIVGTQDQIYARRGLINRITLTAAEIGDTIVNILERRISAMRVELTKLRAEGREDGRYVVLLLVSIVPTGCLGHRRALASHR